MAHACNSYSTIFIFLEFVLSHSWFFTLSLEAATANGKTSTLLQIMPTSHRQFLWVEGYCYPIFIRTELPYFTGGRNSVQYWFFFFYGRLKKRISRRFWFQKYRIFLLFLSYLHTQTHGHIHSCKILNELIRVARKWKISTKRLKNDLVTSMVPLKSWEINYSNHKLKSRPIWDFLTTICPYNTSRSHPPASLKGQTILNQPTNFTLKTIIKI